MEFAKTYARYTKFRREKKRPDAGSRRLTAALGPLCDMIWPPECPLARRPVDRQGHLSAAAWRRLDFISDPHCETCGSPLPYSGGGASDDGLICGACIGAPPVWDFARAPLVYGEASKPLVLALKKADRRDMLPLFARWMAASVRAELSEACLIIPVPLHWRRLFARRYNQAALLAQALGRETGLPVETGCLYRRRATPSQAGQGVRGRRRNMAGAFAIRRPERLKDRPVLLVDDVLTTGATVAACSHKLKRAGSPRVGIVTLCRVVRGVDVTI